MTNNLIKQINQEILIFVGLSVINIVFSAIVLAVGIMFIVNHISVLIESNQFLTIDLGYVVVGCIFSVIGFWWILPSSSVMDFITDIKLDIYKEKGHPSDEKTVSLIVKMVSYFRKHTTIVNKMILISRLGGIFFIANGIISSVDLFLKYTSSVNMSYYNMQIFATILVFLWGTIGIFLPRLIMKFAAIWEYRLKESDRIEKILREQFGS